MTYREQQIVDLLPLVHHIARQIARKMTFNEIDEYISDGSIGLIHAVDTFDKTRGVPLNRFAYIEINGAILNGIRKRDPVSERVRRTLRENDRKRYALATQRGELPTMREMENCIHGLKRAQQEAKNMMPISLDAPITQSEHAPIKENNNPANIIVMHEHNSDVRNAINKLPARERTIIIEHYFADQSLRSLSKEQEISPQRVSQIHISAIAQLQTELKKAC